MLRRRTPAARAHHPARRVAAVLLTVLSVAAGGAMVQAPAAGAAAGAVTITGHGYGHGRGMGQYGALGYARDRGWSAGQILNHFYGNTQMANVNPGTNVSVWLKAQDGKPLKVFAADAFQVNGITVDGTAQISLDGGTTWVLRVAPRVAGTNCRSDWGTPVVLGGSGVTVRVSSPIDPVDDVWRMLGICGANGSIRHYRGALDAVYSTTTRVVNQVGVDAYIRSVVPRESPSSWPAEALKAQAVAARSYSLSEGGENGSRFGFAKTCDDTQCQVYSGAGLNGQRQEPASTDSAVNATSGQVRRFSNGTLARTEFSSSTGGHTSGTPQCSACSFPTVVDEGDSASPYHDWSVDIPIASIESAYGIGTFQRIDITSRNGVGAEGGRVLKMDVVGSAKTASITGDAFRSQFDLRSNWFSVAGGGGGGGGGGAGLPATDLPWHARSTPTGGPDDLTVGYGRPGDQALCGDWDGDGKDGLVTVKDANWYFRNSTASGPVQSSFRFGNPGDRHVVGDWNGDGIDTVGNFKDGVFYLRNSNSPGADEIVVRAGVAGDKPVVGDWDGDGKDEVGTFSGGYWFLRDELNGPVVAAYRSGNGADTPLVGDWNGDGTGTTGQVYGATWYLKNAPKTPGDADIPAFTFGQVNDQVRACDFDGDKRDGPVAIHG